MYNFGIYSPKILSIQLSTFLTASIALAVLHFTCKPRFTGLFYFELRECVIGYKDGMTYMKRYIFQQKNNLIPNFIWIKIICILQMCNQKIESYLRFFMQKLKVWKIIANHTLNFHSCPSFVTNIGMTQKIGSLSLKYIFLTSQILFCEI